MHSILNTASGCHLAPLAFSHYRDEALSGSELTAKLEPAFLSGLRCAQPLIRAKFFEVFDNSMKRRVYERLLYVTCSQNWEAMGSHFWIKQCIEVGQVDSPLCLGEAGGFLRGHRRQQIICELITFYCDKTMTMPTYESKHLIRFMVPEGFSPEWCS